MEVSARTSKNVERRYYIEYIVRNMHIFSFCKGYISFTEKVVSQ